MKRLNINKKKLAMAICLNIFGNFLYAIGVIVFCEPNSLITGGVTGISLALHYALNINTSYFTFAFNGVFFIIGLVVLGKKFALSTLCSSIIYPCWMLLLEQLNLSVFATNDLLVATLASGLFMGIGIGLVMRSGGSTGGIDVLVLILHKYVNLSIGLGVTILDVVTLALQMFQPEVSFTIFGYGIIMIIIYSVLIDKVVLFGNNKIQIKILTRKEEQMSEMILNQMDRGLTYLHSKTGYLKEEVNYILTVVDIRELPKAKKMIYGIDEDAFVVISNVSEVRGHGFSSEKIYQSAADKIKE